MYERSGAFFSPYITSYSYGLAKTKLLLPGALLVLSYRRSKYLYRADALTEHAVEL